MGRYPLSGTTRAIPSIDWHNPCHHAPAKHWHNLCHLNTPQRATERPDNRRGVHTPYPARFLASPLLLAP